MTDDNERALGERVASIEASVQHIQQDVSEAAQAREGQTPRLMAAG